MTLIQSPAQGDVAPQSLKNLHYKVAHGSDRDQEGTASSIFALVKCAGISDANGVYRSSGRRWLDADVLQNGCSDCIISREAQTTKAGVRRHGFVIGRNGQPLYGSPTEQMQPPSGRWKVLAQGASPAPEVGIFATWAEVCAAGTQYFATEASAAARDECWEAVVALVGRALDCQEQATPKGVTGARGKGSTDGQQQFANLLAMRADALLRLGHFRRALIDACASVHFVPAFEWSMARARGITACKSMRVVDGQAKLLMEEACRRDAKCFQGLEELSRWTDAMLQRAQEGKLQAMVIQDTQTDDGRIYFRVVDPEECKIRAGPAFDAKIVGERDFGDLIRGRRIVENGSWLELHVAEVYDDSGGELTAFVPIFTEGSEEERDEILERCTPSDHPPQSTWEKLGLAVKPLGLKPPHGDEMVHEVARWKEEERPRKQQDWPYIYKHGLAIVTMVRGAPEYVIDSFVRYHWGIGFNHIFMYFDDPDDPGISTALEFEDMCSKKQVEGVGISVIRMDSQWWAQAKYSSRFYARRDKTKMYENVCRLHDEHADVDSRRVLVIDLAILEAHRMGIDWFAPLNVDECIYVPQRQDCSARRYLGSKPRSVQKVRLWNHEAVPEQEECDDWFRDCTLFKINLNHCQGFVAPREYDQYYRRLEGRELEPDALGEETRWWPPLREKILSRRASAIDSFGSALFAQKLVETPSASSAATAMRSKATAVGAFDYFLSDSDGRSIVRLDQHFKPPIPHGVRDFLADSGEPLQECYQANSPSDAVILHYPHASFSVWQEQCRQLGGKLNPDMWASALSKSSLETQRHFYNTFVMQHQYNEMAYLAEYGLVQRIKGVSSLLAEWDEPPAPEEPLPGQQRWIHPSGLQLATPS